MLSPNGGENCPTIFRWTSSGLAPSTRIKFDLFKGPGPIYQPGTPYIGIMAEGIPVGTGAQSYTWTGLMLDGSKLPAGNDYWIVIQTMDFGMVLNVEDASDAPFSICEVPETRLEISPTDSRKLAINKKEIFLLEVSYFNPLALDTSNFHNRQLLERDLDLFKQYGFNCIRVTANNLDFSPFEKDPTTRKYSKLIRDNYNRMKTLIGLCDSKGIIIDFTLFVYPYNKDVNYINWDKNMPKNLEEAKSYLNVFTTEFKGYKNWFWDVFNEWDAWPPTWWNPPPTTGATVVVKALLAQVKLVDPERLCTASGNSTDPLFLSLKNLYIIAPHTDHCKWAYEAGDDFGSEDVLEEFLSYTRCTIPGCKNKPIHLQEPPRRGYKLCWPLTTAVYCPDNNRFKYDLTAVRRITDDAAGWCLHNMETCVNCAINIDGNQNYAGCTNGGKNGLKPKCGKLDDTNGMLLTGGPTGSGQLDDEEKKVVYAAAGIIGNPPESFFIKVMAGPGGTISPQGNAEGIVVVSIQESRTFTIAANPGYKILGVKVDGIDWGAIVSFSFKNINTNHSIAATFSL